MSAALPESVAGRYAIERKLAEGGCGVVYAAYDRVHERRVALKTGRQADAAQLVQLKQEFRALADVVHPNLVRFHDLVLDEGRVYFSMELLDGVSLMRWVRPGQDDGGRWSSPATEVFPQGTDVVAQARRSRVRPLAPDRVPVLRAVLRQLAEGVAAIHAAGLLHLDLKPSNVLVTPEGRVVILDFGLATQLGRSDEVEASSWGGTADYMAPEQAAAQPVSPATDWYAVGVMIHEALCGQLPFDGISAEVLVAKVRGDAPRLAELVPDAPADLLDLAQALLARSPEERLPEARILERLGVREEDQRSSSVRRTRSGEAPLVGRERHLAALEAALAAVGAAEPVVAELCGPSGMGKSTLLRHFLVELRNDDGTVVLQGRCYEHEAVPFNALDSVMDALADHLKGLPESLVLQLLPRHVSALALVFPTLRRVPAVLSATNANLPRAQPDPLELRRRAFLALKQLLGAMSDRARLVLAVDDLQWGDVDSAALLASVLRPPDAPALLLVACHRGEEAGEGTFLGELAHQLTGAGVRRERVEVGPLAHEDGESLARLLLGREGREAGRHAAEISTDAGGSPFFIEQLARHAGGAADERVAGVSLDLVLRDRLRRLPGDELTLLKLVAVAGHPIRVADLRGAAHLKDPTTLASLAAARRVRTGGARGKEQVECYHDRVREVSVADLGAEELRATHLALALALDGASDADPEQLAQHYEAAGERERAAAMAARAAERAEAALAFERAAELYAQALALASPPPDETRRLLELQGNAFVNAGRGRQAAEAFLRGAEGAPRTEALELRRRAAGQLLMAGHIEEGLEALGPVLNAVGLRLYATPRSSLPALLLRRAQLKLRGLGFRERDASEVSQAELTRVDACWTASICLAMVDTFRGAYYTAELVRLALKAGEPSRVVLGLSLEAMFVSAPSREAAEKACRITAQATSLAERLGKSYARGLSLFADGFVIMNAHRWSDALPKFEEAERHLRECHGVLWELTMNQAMQLNVLYDLGQLAVFAARSQRALQECVQRGAGYGMTIFQTGRPNLVWLMADDPTGALEATERAGLWAAQGFHMQHWWQLFARTQIELYQGEADAAYRRMTTTWAPLKASLLLSAQGIRMEALLLRGRAALAAAASSSGPEALLRQVDADAKRLAREDCGAARAMSALLRGGAAKLRGDRKGAAEALEESRKIGREVELGLWAVVAAWRLGEVEGGEAGASRVAEARAWLVAQNVANPERFMQMLLPTRA